MVSSASQGRLFLAPSCLQGLPIRQLVVALQEPGQHHLGALFCRYLKSQRCFCVYLIRELEHMRLACSRLNGALVSHDLEALVLALQKDLRLCRGPTRVFRHCLRREGLQDLCDAHQDLPHARRLPVDPPDQVSMQGREEHHCHFAALCLTVIDPIFLASQGLVLCDVQDLVRAAGDLVHLSLSEDGLDVIAPGRRKSRVRRSCWRFRCNILPQVPMRC